MVDVPRWIAVGVLVTCAVITAAGCSSPTETQVSANDQVRGSSVVAPPGRATATDGPSTTCLTVPVTTVPGVPSEEQGVCAPPPGPTSTTSSTAAAQVEDLGPPPSLVVPERPVSCHWTRHTPAGVTTAPWFVEYVSSTEVAGVIAYRDVDGSMVPADWQRHCSTITGPSP